MAPLRPGRFAKVVVIRSNDSGSMDFGRLTGAVFEDRTTFESSRLQVKRSGSYPGDSDEKDDTFLACPLLHGTHGDPLRAGVPPSSFPTG